MAVVPTTQATVGVAQQLEALRRRAELGPSSAGIPAQASNSLSPSNPIANEGGTELLTTPPPTPAPIQGGAAGTQSDSQVAGLKQQKTEAQTITSALIARQKALGDQGQ